MDGEWKYVVNSALKLSMWQETNIIRQLATI